MSNPMTRQEIAEILKLHTKWLRGEADGKSANLRSANLRGADLRGADLQSANLRSANLRSADLRGADLQGAYLRGADLQGADLRGADLQGADLQGADLRGADLRGADLRGADLRGAKNLGTIAEVPDRYYLGSFGPLGSRHDYLIVMVTPTESTVLAGCFAGSLDEFAKVVQTTHGTSHYAKEYGLIITLLKLEQEELQA